MALLPEIVDESDAERVAARVLEALREPFFVLARNVSSPAVSALPFTRATA
ncbi:hypothetical protein ACVBEH_01400 [Roseateles sp. GG27B]